jgi:hypothetical protein
MTPITDFLSCTRVFNEFGSLSPAQRHYMKSYATGLVAAGNKPAQTLHAKSFQQRANAPSTGS